VRRLLPQPQACAPTIVSTPAANAAHIATSHHGIGIVVVVAVTITALLLLLLPRGLPPR
jgi:hypothetical protein